MLYIPYDEVKAQLVKTMGKVGVSPAKADRLGDIFATNSLEGVYSHGVNRFPRFIQTILDGFVDPAAEAERVAGLGGLEVWDGHLGIGPLAAEKCMGRAVELAREQGIACVAIRNSNHWMRAGRYGWQAAEAGMIGICWTNTYPNMPVWGATDCRVGNDPIVMAVPRKKGHVVLDMSMSQFAYGKLEVAALEGRQTICDAGYDTEGHLTRDPAQVLKSQRVLPIGYWKGSAMAILLDLIAAGVAMGRTTYALGQSGGEEAGLTQIFIAINYKALVDEAQVEASFDDAINYVLASHPIEGERIRYPGQSVARYREENTRKGIPINEATWEKVLAF